METTERKLTETEQRRKEIYEKLSEKMKEQGYTEKKLLVSISEANKTGVCSMLPFMAVILLLYYYINRTELLSMELFIWQLPFTLLLTVVHELIHGITWGIFAKKHFQSINFGVIWKMLTPYCHCSEPLKKWQYVLGAAMPTLVLGAGLGVVAIMTGNLMCLYLAEFMTLGGGGDFLIIVQILRYRTDKKEQVYYDHPYECGVVVFEK